MNFNIFSILLFSSRMKLSPAKPSEPIYSSIMRTTRAMPNSETKTEYYQILRQALSINSMEPISISSNIPAIEDPPGSADEVLRRVSKAFQAELYQLQNPSDCNNIPTLSCGHVNECGLTCQIHHRAACLMYSYALKMPLIHTHTKNWPFSKPWTAAFLPIGSACKPNNSTVSVTWVDSSNIHKKRTKPNSKNPLKNGLPIRSELARIVEKFHPSPFLWWVGQFIKYVLLLSPQLHSMVDSRRRELLKYRGNSNSPQLVGVHIRRTDKASEVAYANHSIKDYMDPADAFFKKYYRFQDKSKSVMIASDDATLIKQIQLKYPLPEWNVFSVNPSYTKTLGSQKERKHFLLETMRDFILLSEADYIICGFSSNVCRLLLEIKAATHLNATEVFKSVDDGYCFGLSGVYCPEVIVKV